MAFADGDCKMKLLLDKLKLQLLLQEKKEYIGYPIVGIDLLFSAIAFVVSLLCSDFHDVGFLDALVIKTVAWIVAVVFFVLAVRKIIISARRKYTKEDLLRDIENLNEIAHVFSLVAIKDTFKEHSNRFLLYYDKRWECWFFFSFKKTENDNEKFIANRLSNMLKVDADKISIHYLTDRIQMKYSVSDDVNKLYQHHLFKGIVSDYPDDMQKDEFEIDGVLYRWMTIDEMEQDENIMQKNKDIVAFVKEKIS